MSQACPPTLRAAVGPAEPMRPGFLLPAVSLCQRELVRFLRQRNRVVGALATPIVFWLLIGGGMGRSLNLGSAGGESYIRYFFPGTLVMILLFTAIFSTISVIEDRREGFLQSVLVAPVSRMSVVLGKVLGGTLLASGQGLVFLALSPAVGFRPTILSVLTTVLAMLVVSFGLTSLGLMIAWRMNSSQGFHALMNLFLMPMWFLSGAMFPPGGAWTGLKWVMAVNPLTYGVAAVHGAMELGGSAPTHGPGLALGMGVSCVFAGAMYLVTCLVAGRE